MAKRLNEYERLIEPEHVPEGFLLVDPGDRLTLGKFIFLGLWLALWCGISFTMFAALLLVFIESPHIGTLVPVLFLSIFVAIGLFGLFWAFRSLYVIAKLTPGEVVMSSYPFRLGEFYDVRFRRQLRSGSTSRSGSIGAKWRCYEWVQYRQGTDTRTVTHTLWEMDLPERSVASGTRRIEYDTRLQAGPEHPPSFDASHNKVRWELEVTMKLPGIPKDSSQFRFKILPEVV